MSHRAGTGDAPIPGLVTSRRNPAYKLRLIKAKEAEAAERAIKIQQQQAVKAANKIAKQRVRRSPSTHRSPERENSADRQSREKKEEADRRAKEAKEEEAKKLKLVEDEEHRQRWAEQEAKWAEERRQREDQKRQEDERKAARQNKLRGAFSMADDEDDEEEKRAKILAEKAKSSRLSAKLAVAPSTDLVVPAGGLAAAGARKAAAENQDAVSLRASLADPSGPRVHSPGEVAEHFRRISEMKRRFRRPEFGGPARKKSPSRSRSRERYNSVWIKPSGSDRRD